MSDLPAGWNESTLVNLIGKDGLFSDGDWVESKDQDPNGAIRLLQLADIGDGKFVNKSHRFVNDKKFELLNFTEILEDDVLVARMPDPLGRACLMPKLPQKCITVVDVAIIRPGKDSVLPRWLMHFLNSPEIRQRIELLSSGTTRKRISRGNLAQIELPIPPLNEQKRIAEKLDSLLARVDSCQSHLERVPQILKRFRQSVLAAATSGHLTEDWREEKGMNGEWETVKLSEVATSRLGKMLDAAKNRGELRPYLRNINVRWFTFELDDVQELRISDDEAKTLGVRKGDVLVCEGGEPGRCAVWRGEDDLYLFQKALHRVRVDNEKMLPEWLCYCLKLEADSGQLADYFTGTTIKHFTGVSISRFEFTLPSLKEQAEIVRRVEKLFAYAETLEARYYSASEHVERLTPSLLAKAFRGELVGQEQG